MLKSALPLDLCELSRFLEDSAGYARLPHKIRPLWLQCCLALASDSRESTLSDLVARLSRSASKATLFKVLPPLLPRYGTFLRRGLDAWRLQSPEVLRLRHDEFPCCVLDVEATGGRPPLHRIIQIGIIRVEPDGRKRTFGTLVDPGREVPPYVARLTGIHSKRLQGAPPFEEILDDVLDFVEGCLLVAHDASSDVELLNYEVHRARGHLLSNPVLCTATAAKAVLPDLARTGLVSVATKLGIPFEQKHDALEDAQITLHVWQGLQAHLQDAGLRTVLDVTAFQGTLPSPEFLENSITLERLRDLPEVPGVISILDGRRNVLHCEATGNVKKTMADMFLSHKMQPPARKRVVRAARDLAVQEFPSLEEARTAFEALPAPRLPSRRRRGTRRKQANRKR